MTLVRAKQNRDANFVQRNVSPIRATRVRRIAIAVTMIAAPRTRRIATARNFYIASLVAFDETVVNF
jgi:hypothetical protein